MAESDSRPLPPLAVAAFAVGIGLGFVLLMGTLLSECGAGADAIEAYAAEIRGGATVGASIGGAEAAALTEALRGTRSVSVGNFLSQGGRSCYYVRLVGDGGSTSARFLLKEGNSGVHVVGATLSRACTCPDDVDEPCRIDGP